MANEQTIGKLSLAAATHTLDNFGIDLIRMLET